MYALGLLVAVVGSAVTVALPLADAYGLIKVFVGLIGAGILWSRPSVIKWTGFERPIAAFAAAFLLSTAFSIDPWAAVVGLYSQPFNGAASLVACLLILYAVRSSDEWREGPFFCASLIGIANGVACALQLVGWFQDPYNTAGGRALGLMGSPIFTGAVLAPCLPPAIFLARRGSWVGWAGAIGAAFGLVACGSRGPWIAALAGLWGLAAASGSIRPRWRHLGALGAILAVLVGLGAVMGKAKSDSGRIAVWILAAQAGIDRPIGWGPDTFPLVMRRIRTPEMVREKVENQASAHNDILQAWATLGFLGAISLIWLWASMLYRSWEWAAYCRWATWGEKPGAVFGSVLALFIVAKFNAVPPSALFVVAALLGSIASSSDRTQSEKQWTNAIGIAGTVLFLAVGVPTMGLVKAEVLQAAGVYALKRGDVVSGSNLIRRANESVPHEVFFAARRFNVIRRLSEISDDRTREDYALRVLRSSERLTLARPQDPASFEMAASAEIWAAGILGDHLMKSAARTARRAMELDPLDDFAAVKLLEASRAMGDEAGQVEAINRIILVEELRK